jgi:hypothetical protein
MPCEAVLVTPTFVKAYRNRHLLNIWAGAQEALALANRWVFIGYSLPDDDIHIKGLLLRAKRMRIDKGAGAPEIQVVTHKPDEDLRMRFHRLFGAAISFDPPTGGFTAYVTRAVREAERDAARRQRNKEREERERVRRAKKRQRARNRSRRRARS